MLDKDKVKAFLDYTQSKVGTVSTIESQRLADLKDARYTIFKYALPTSIINAVVGVIAAFKTSIGLWILLPVSLLLILIYFLAKDLDLQKHAERIEIIMYTEVSLYEIRLQENELLGKA